MNIGAMRDRFAVEQALSTQDTYGQNVPTYEVVREVWGSLKNLSGRQIQLAQANTITATATHQINVRYCSDIQVARNRLKLTTADGTARTFSINNVNDVDNRHVEMILTVTEVPSVVAS